MTLTIKISCIIFIVATSVSSSFGQLNKLEIFLANSGSIYLGESKLRHSRASVLAPARIGINYKIKEYHWLGIDYSNISVNYQNRNNSDNLNKGDVYDRSFQRIRVNYMIRSNYNKFLFDAKVGVSYRSGEFVDIIGEVYLPSGEFREYLIETSTQKNIGFIGGVRVSTKIYKGFNVGLESSYTRYLGSERGKNELDLSLVLSLII